MRCHVNKFIILVGIALALCACDHSNKQKEQEQVLTVKLESPSSSLFFNSTINPSKVVNVASPIGGVIEQVGFTYGQMVKKGQLLFKLNSQELSKDYNAALTDYINKKEAWNNSQLNFSGTVNLNKEGIVSSNDFSKAETSNNDAYISFLQAKWKLQAVIKQIGDTDENLSELIFNRDLRNQHTLLKILTAKANTFLIHSPATGIALKPISNSQEGEGNPKTFMVGDTIKSGQTLLSVGDMSGIHLNFQIDEINLSKLHKGQQVTITSLAFPEITLAGLITNISNQANPSNGQGLPDFPVEVLVDKLDPTYLNKIHVGMSAQISLTLKGSPSISIPIQSVTSQGENNVVMVIDPNTGKPHSRIVTTGPTSLDSVTITSGLKPGEKIVVPH